MKLPKGGKSSQLARVRGDLVTAEGKGCHSMMSHLGAATAGVNKAGGQGTKNYSLEVRPSTSSIATRPWAADFCSPLFLRADPMCPTMEFQSHEDLTSGLGLPTASVSSPYHTDPIST